MACEVCILCTPCRARVLVGLTGRVAKKKAQEVIDTATAKLAAAGPAKRRRVGDSPATASTAVSSADSEASVSVRTGAGSGVSAGTGTSGASDAAIQGSTADASDTATTVSPGSKVPGATAMAAPPRPHGALAGAGAGAGESAGADAGVGGGVVVFGGTVAAASSSAVSPKTASTAHAGSASLSLPVDPDHEKAEELMIANEYRRLNSRKVLVMQLKTMLKSNGQSASGTKMELARRAAICKVRGALPECPKCHRGVLRHPSDGGNGGPRFWCPGWFDRGQHRRHKCGHTQDDAPRTPWNVSM